MATSLIAKRATTSIGRASDLFRTSFAFLRGLSTSTTTSPADVAAADGAKKPKRKKKKNLFEVAQFLPNWGLGYHMAKTHWAEVSYEITKINLYKDGRHGKAWGIAHKNDKALIFLREMYEINLRGNLRFCEDQFCNTKVQYLKDSRVVFESRGLI
ncbi:uncharacterized protein LOC121753086 isoform X2 [Salvia splendens]|uniref:uncharacterized protein LOC121753086 isoform X2 n=1 Tax=Salvia splendens TaxID=180675 RepID=UPI001C263389|nr:uncharacterized protein LOC121753086 isoform X2 [Salvia splendens]